MHCSRDDLFGQGSAHGLIWTAPNQTAARLFLQILVWCRPSKSLRVAHISQAVVDALIPYSERHYNRVEEALKRSYLLDYTLHAMHAVSGGYDESAAGSTQPMSWEWSGLAAPPANVMHRSVIEFGSGDGQSGEAASAEEQAGDSEDGDGREGRNESGDALEGWGSWAAPTGSSDESEKVGSDKWSASGHRAANRDQVCALPCSSLCPVLHLSRSLPTHIPLSFRSPLPLPPIFLHAQAHASGLWCLSPPACFPLFLPSSCQSISCMNRQRPGSKLAL